MISLTLNDQEVKFRHPAGSPIEMILTSAFFDNMDIIHHADYCEAIDGSDVYRVEMV